MFVYPKIENGTLAFEVDSRFFGEKTTSINPRSIYNLIPLSMSNGHFGKITLFCSIF